MATNEHINEESANKLSVVKEELSDFDPALDEITSAGEAGSEAVAEEAAVEEVAAEDVAQDVADVEASDVAEAQEPADTRESAVAEETADAPSSVGRWFRRNVKPLVTGVAAAAIVCAGMFACARTDGVSLPNNAILSHYYVTTPASQIHYCCIDAQISDNPIWLMYDVSSQNIESITLFQSDAGPWSGIYSMYYRAYVPGLGWMGWAMEGAPVGCEGLGKTIERLEVCIVMHDGLGEAEEDDLTECLEKTGMALAYRNAPFTKTVPELIQYPELQWGCESVAAVIALQAYGFDIQKTDIADKYLTYSSSDYINSYVGNPYLGWGMGRCMPPAIVKAVNKYLEEQSSPLQARDITGVSFDELCAYIDDGYPVIVWTTQYERYPYVSGKQDKYVNYSNEHAVVIYGYDNDANTIEVSDPQLGLTKRDLKKFVEYFKMTGQMAVVIQ